MSHKSIYRLKKDREEYQRKKKEGICTAQSCDFPARKDRVKCTHHIIIDRKARNKRKKELRIN